jgi:hypothetical protein
VEQQLSGLPETAAARIAEAAAVRTAWGIYCQSSLRLLQPQSLILKLLWLFEAATVRTAWGNCCPDSLRQETAVNLHCCLWGFYKAGYWCRKFG